MAIYDTIVMKAQCPEKYSFVGIRKLRESREEGGEGRIWWEGCHFITQALKKNWV